MVDSLGDEHYNQVSDGCRSTAGTCTLRAAIEVATGYPLATTVSFKVGGTIRLGSPLAVRDGGNQGASITIVGPGQDKLKIDGQRNTRIFDVDSPLAVSGLTLSGGHSTEGGGAIAITARGVMALSDVRIADSEAKNGGGIANMGGRVTVTGSTFERNVATAPPDSDEEVWGGGLFTDGGSVFISRSLLRRNESYGGAAIASTNGASVSVSETRLLDNKAKEGAVVSAFAGSVNLIEVIVDENKSGGAALFFESANVSIVRSTVSRNEGIAVFLGTSVGGSLFIESSTISGNEGPDAGAVMSNGGGGLTTILNSTLVGGKDGTLFFNAYADMVILKDTIITSKGAPRNCAFGRAPVSQGHNLSSDDSCKLSGPADIAGRDPKLQPLRDNGGPTQTHALAKDSPAIDAGDCRGVRTDQRGANRSAGKSCDIGAFESGATPGSAPAPLATETPAPTLMPTSTPTPTQTPVPTQTPPAAPEVAPPRTGDGGLRWLAY